MDLRRQRHLSENPRFVTKIVIAAYAKSIGGVKAEISQSKLPYVLLASTAVEKNQRNLYPGTFTRKKTRRDRTIFS